ncbi:MAG: YciI family protein [Methylocystis sp.]|nr:YciI family protein [Methylocystis sp.]
MLFAAICLDRPGQLELRLANRAAHLAFLEQHAAQVKLGGPLLDAAQEKPIGSLLIVDCDNEAAARALLENDPYAQAGLFGSVELRPFRRVVGADL